MVLKNYFLISLCVFALFAVSCEEEKTAINESQTLVEHLESTDSPLKKDYVNSDLPSIMPAKDVKALNATGQVYVIDIRSAEDFAAGHISNAVNVPVNNIITHMEELDTDAYDKIAVVCYTGQTAGFATSLLRLLGYDNVFSMKWGMTSWNEQFAGKWNSVVASGNAYASRFTTEAAEKAPAGDLPEILTGETEASDILKSRVTTVLADGFGAAKISNQEVFGNLDNYYIVNYWNEAHYNDPGHIPGAVQYTPKQSIKLDADLKTLPTDKTIVVYCYTGQTSAFLTAYLRVLGYDAKSLLFGTNGMIYDVMVEKGGMHHYSDAQIMGYDYE